MSVMASSLPFTVHTNPLRVRIDFGLSKGPIPGLSIVSSANVAPLASDPDYWEDGFASAMDDRFASDGAAKGRVIAVWQRDGAARVPIAAVTWHRADSGPLCILDLGCASHVPGPRRDDLRAILLVAMLELAKHQLVARSGVELRWWVVGGSPASSPRAMRMKATRARADALAFAPLTPRQKPGWAGRDWLGARRFG
jgi:hypothetical protein